MSKSRYLVTGAAGFIGAAVSHGLLSRGHEVVGIDNMNPYYDVRLKEARLRRLEGNRPFRFIALDLADRQGMASLFETDRFDVVINLAAQAGVRYSIENPLAYVDSNLVGFGHVLEGCRKQGVRHLVYASSSSVYGRNRKVPFSVSDNVDHPVSLYAATKKANELMAYTYSHLYGLPATGLRFFTVYGPWGRPDMAYFLFTKALFEGKTIRVFNHGKMRRDFTYIDDIVEGVLRVSERIPVPRPLPENENSVWSEEPPHRVYNIGNNNPESLLHFIEVLERLTGCEARKEFLPMQPGDVPETYADIEALVADVGFRPATSLEQGLERFVRWYREYYRV